MSKNNSDVNSDVWFTVEQLANLKLPGYPRSGRRWHDRAKLEGWNSRDVASQGRTGKRTEYAPPPEIMALIEARQRNEFPGAGVKPQHTVEQLAAHYNVPQENVVRFEALLQRVADSTQATVRISKRFDFPLPIEWTSLIQELMAMHGLTEAGALRVIEVLKHSVDKTNTLK